MGKCTASIILNLARTSLRKMRRTRSSGVFHLQARERARTVNLPRTRSLVFELPSYDVRIIVKNTHV